MSDEDMSDVDATNYPQQDLLDTRAQLEDRLQKALTSIDSYQDERYRACQALGIKDPTTITKEFENELYEKMFVIDCNLKRRQLNNFQKTELALKSKAILDEIAKRNSKANLKQNSSSVRFLTVGGRVDEQIGERAGVSRDTVRKVEKILDGDLPEEGLDQIRTGEISINQAYNQILDSEVEEQQKKTVSSMPLEDWQETHPEIAKSPFQSLGEINRAIARLWTALTSLKHMPTREDDVKLDCIKPTRQQREDIVNGSSEIERIFLHNWIVWLKMALTDTEQILDKADVTAYDTRE